MQIHNVLTPLSILNVWGLVFENGFAFAVDRWQMEPSNTTVMFLKNRNRQDFLRRNKVKRRDQQYGSFPYVTFILSYTNSSSSGPVVSNLGLSLIGKAIASSILVDTTSKSATVALLGYWSIE